MRTFLAAALAVVSAWAVAGEADFTVVNSDSPSPLVDAPQTGFSPRARTDRAEQHAVYEIMAATGNAWASDIPDVCRGRWHGIECMPDRDEVYHVVSLSFGALSADTAFPVCDRRSSSLSPALARLPHLRSLFLYQCSSPANPTPIPSFLARLGATLRTLVLRENGHVGPIPAELANLTSLRVLDLHGNALRSTVPPSLATSLPHLRLLDLSGNKLTGPLPRFSSPSLKVLDLSGNSLHGPIPPSLGACRALVKLDLSRNRLAGAIPSSLTALGELILLDLSHNLLSGPLPASLSELTSLRTLVLSGNDMGPGALPGAAFQGLTALTALILSDMGLRGAIPASIGLLRGLRVLHLDGNGFNGSVPETFRHLVNLSELRINDNQLTGPLPFPRRVLWRMGTKLRAANNRGLCYPAGTGAEAAPEASYLPGVLPCAVTTAATAAALPTAAPAPAAAAASTAATNPAASRPPRGGRQ